MKRKVILFTIMFLFVFGTQAKAEVEIETSTFDVENDGQEETIEKETRDLDTSTENIEETSDYDEVYEEPEEEIVHGKVLSIISEENIEIPTSGLPIRQTVQTLEVEVKDGSMKGKVIEVENIISEDYLYQIEAEEGMNVLLIIFEVDGNEQVYLYDYQRDNYVYLIVIIFAVLILVIGGFKGLKSLVTLAITLLGIFYIFLPKVLNGGNPILWSILVAIATILITMLIVAGFNKKAVTAIIGTSAGVLFGGSLALIVGKLANLTGLSMAESQMLMYIPQGTEFDFQGLLFESIILGTLGAVMDVSISIASAIKEVHDANPNLSVKELLVSGMNIGKDIMGTMSNTLILAYVGTSLPLLLLLMAYNTPMIDILNQDIIVTEIVRSFVGTIGLIIAIPVTALVGAIFISGSPTNKEDNIEV